MKRQRPIISLLLVSFMSGCSSISLPSLPSMPWSSQAPQPNATSEALFAEGMSHFGNQKYSLAIDRFQRIKAEFPFSPELVPAELKLAETYYLNKQYPEAVAAFKEFQTLHPNNENIPFVVYHLGLAHFEQFTSSDRYQKITEIAKDYFGKVVKDYPNSAYAKPAGDKLAQCLGYLSEYEFHVANFYFNEKKYPAAIDRFEGILRRYPTTPVAVKALYYLGESYRLDKNSVKAALAYQALIQHYPADPLAKSAESQLSDLTKEKADPLAMLLKREGRPSSPPESRQQAEGSRQQKDLNLVAKKEVVHEEAGDEKGLFRRVIDTLNPFSSSADKKESGSRKTEGARTDSDKKKERDPSTGAGSDSQLVTGIDRSLNQKGIETSAEKLAVKPPSSDLPKVEESAPSPSNTAELLGNIDASLRKGGKGPSEPAPPEPAPIFSAPNTAAAKPAAPASSSAASAGLISGIDEALKRKGIDPQKIEVGSSGGSSQGPASQKPAARPGKVELGSKLPQEKGPLFLDRGKYQAQEKAQEGEAGKEAVAQPPANLEPRNELPQAVVKGVQPAAAKPAETKVAEKKQPSAEDDENKGELEKIKEDLERLRNLLNPFNW